MHRQVLLYCFEGWVAVGAKFTVNKRNVRLKHWILSLEEIALVLVALKRAVVNVAWRCVIQLMDAFPQLGLVSRSACLVVESGSRVDEQSLVACNRTLFSENVDCRFSCSWDLLLVWQPQATNRCVKKAALHSLHRRLLFKPVYDSFTWLADLSSVNHDAWFVGGNLLNHAFNFRNTLWLFIFAIS